MQRSNIQIPAINGLILTGGKSKRMGEDKALIKYYEKSQQAHIADLLKAYCQETFLSIAKDSGLDKYQSDLPVISDVCFELGPIGGILSAFQFDPKVAWLTVACDLPYLNKATLAILVAGRNPKKLASCFYNASSSEVEPLITIWEPISHQVLLDNFSDGVLSPKAILGLSDIELIDLKETFRAKNVNTPEERKEAERYISKQNLIEE